MSNFTVITFFYLKKNKKIFLFQKIDQKNDSYNQEYIQ